MKDSYVFYKDKLQGEYKDVFDQVEMYVNCENIDELTREDRLGSLLDMLLSAQESGRPVKKVVGNSIEDFCKMFCSMWSSIRRRFLQKTFFLLNSRLLLQSSSFASLSILRLRRRL